MVDYKFEVSVVVCAAPVVQNGREGEWTECWGVVLWTVAYMKPDVLNMIMSDEELYDLCFPSNIIRVFFILILTNLMH